MTLSNAWKRVSKSFVYLICEKPDWCCVSIDGSAALCQRVSEGAIMRVGDAGWLHRLSHRQRFGLGLQQRSSYRVVKQACAVDFGPLAARFCAAVRTDALRAFADEMGLSVASLHRLGIGRATAVELDRLGTGCRGPGCWTFPMTSSHSVVCGIRLRTQDGFKYAIKGSLQGLFVPTDVLLWGAVDPLLVSEGPTDCAALLDLGFTAVGRPSCTGGTRLLTRLVQNQRPTSVVIVADADIPGQRGAESLATALVPYVRSIRIITPPLGTKDVRGWKLAGATHSDLQRAIDAALTRRLSIRIKEVSQHGR